ncbi:hypothetical protein [Actinoplanes oblitus]|uniref:hypothetical protein n=1 Tax=Actinoplanes oblitus TaxID=3040509 RepID=UPI002E1EC78F
MRGFAVPTRSGGRAADAFHRLAPTGLAGLHLNLFQAPRSWVAASYPTLNYHHQPVRGGHFAAWEEPELFAAALREAFRSAR